MLYYAYEAQRDAMAGVRLFAETTRSLLDQAWPLVGDLPLMRGAAAAMTLLSRTGLSHERQPFGITSVSVDGAEFAVSEETVLASPFCNLLHFRKAAGPEQPRKSRPETMVKRKRFRRVFIVEISFTGLRLRARSR